MPIPLRSALLALPMLVLCGIEQPATHPVKPANALVDINHATTPELERVPGITPVWAARIIRFRPYRTKLDLMDRGVVPAEVYRQIRDGIVAHRIAEPPTR